MENKKIIRCFIASPSDTEKERNICESIFSELNKGIGVSYGVELKSLRWEYDVRPSIGLDGQDVINKQIGRDYDLFIGIMYTKFGSPTSRAESGTVEEFNNAYEMALKHKKLDIMFYFNDTSIAPSQIDLEQYKKVKDFKDNIVGHKCLYAMFDESHPFEEQLRMHLNKYLIDTFGKINQCVDETTTHISYILRERLDKSLQLFSGQPRIWIDPIISEKSEISSNPDDNYEDRIDISEIINSPESTIISAPPQFGLTCLSHYMILKAWEHNDLWFYINAKKIKSHQITQYVKSEMGQLGIEDESLIKCIVVDEWDALENLALKKLKSICENFKNIPIILMRTIDGAKFIKERQEEINIDRQFKTLFLLAMTRSQIRKAVTEYNKTALIADDDILVEKVVSDLTTLNIHRTPHNCFTLLKVDEKKFDANPVNRSQMLEDVLYVLFEFSEIPQYNQKPDVKDCQFVLGCFCEVLMRENRMTFTREEFISKSREESEKNLIDIDANIVFQILFENNIIAQQDLVYTFKSAFWLLYFCARRMNSSIDFANYVFNSKKYLDYPEIIEFYTGIDRNKTDALKVLMEDIHQTCDTVFQRLNISDKFNPYKYAVWKPTEEHIQKIQQEISDKVLTSGLPDNIKDKYNDKGYNQLTPYNQMVSLHDFFEEYYLYNLIQEIKSSSRALRNSDYANAEVKKSLLSEILRGWLQISKVLFALIPVLASKGQADYGGASFLLTDNFGETEEERARNILFVISTNIVGIFKDDVYSSKIAPLLYDAFDKAFNPLVKQQIALLLVLCRPNKWHEKIEKYIISLPKDSFFLFELLSEMRAQYKFGFTDEQGLRLLSHLTKKCLAKHEFGVKNPSPGHVAKISNAILPKRNIAKDD
jgi:ser/thr phosphatase family protein